MAGKKKRKQSDFKPRDGNLDTFGQFVQKSESENSGQNDFQSQRQTFGQKVQKSKTETHKSQQSTFGQKVQKSESENSGQDDFQSQRQTFGQFVQKSGKETEPEQEEGYDRRDTYRPSQKKAVTRKYTQKRYRKTFGQKVQKLETENKEQTGSDVFREEKTFAGEQKEFQKSKNETFGQKVQKSQTEKKEQPAFGQFVQKSGEEQKADYHRRDTYRQSQKKRDSSKKRVQKEQGSREQKESTFTDNSGSDFTKSTTDTFTGDTQSEFIGSNKLKRKQKQAEKAAEKVRKARKKLPKKREYTLQRVFDEETGKGKYVVVPLEMEKPYKPDGITKKAMQRVQIEGRNFVHGKIAENEKENAAVEGFHKTEQRGEDLFAFIRRQYKGKEYRQRKKIAGLEKKQFKKEVNFQYQKFIEENPQIKKKALQKRLQKQRIKREYLKARQRKAATKTAQEAVFKSANTTTAIARKLQEIARRNIGVFIMVGIMALLLLMIMTSMVSCGAMFAGTQSTILASSYLSEPKEIDAADLQFTRLELDLQKKIDNIETDYPGYDEYDYNLGEIGHNPFTLISYLSAVYTQFTASEVADEVQALFDAMYELTATPVTETRTRSVTNAQGQTVQEEYEVKILRVVLTVKPLESIVAAKMDTEQKETYELYMETGGLLQQFGSPLDLYWYNYVSSYYGYRKNPSTGNEELHRGVDIAVPTGTTVYAAHDGAVTTAAYDSYYGNYVVIEKDGYTTKYAHLNSLQVRSGQQVKKGDAIGTTGNTGSSIGSHLHIECLYNGEYYNPLFYFDVGEGTLYGETPGGGGAGNRPVNVTPPESYDDEAVQALMAEAEKYLGFPYVWGGSSPSTSFDCSGFVCYVFTHSGVHNLPRTTAQGIYDQCTPVSASEAKPGDIIFFTGTYNSASAVSHVGIYCGNGVMIHCGDPIAYASINTPYWQSHFYSFGRLN